MMNLMHWRLLVAVAEAENISRAAEQFGITQSGASQAITQMEEALGVKLFLRERRTTTLTAIGEQVLVRARRMLAELYARHRQRCIGPAQPTGSGSTRCATAIKHCINQGLGTFQRLHH